MTPMSADRPWYEEAFRDAYRKVYPHRDLPSARQEVAGLLEGGVRGRVLDLGCGFGRHSLALRERGVDVVGLDLSEDLLRASRELDGDGLLRGRLVRGDFLALPFADDSFDTVLMLFSSFGYLDEEGNGRVLDGVARILRPGGRAVFDLMNPERIRRTLVPHSSREVDGIRLEESRSLTEGGRRVVKHVHMTDREGHERSWHEDVRMYDSGELRGLFVSRGLGIERVEGDFEGSAYGGDSMRQLVWARRASGR